MVSINKDPYSTKMSSHGKQNILFLIKQILPKIYNIFVLFFLILIVVRANDNKITFLVISISSCDLQYTKIILHHQIT